MRRKYMILLGCIFILAMIYLSGPRLPRRIPDRILPVIGAGIDRIVGYVQDQEAAFHTKPDNEGVILWGDSVGQRTEFVLLYLHGFSASRNEGYPITHDFVHEFKVNAYLPRLAAHGLITDEPLLEMTPAALYGSAKEALAVARVLGQKVVIMGTSTGCTLALMLAADFPEVVDGLILYSPNIRIKNKLAPLLSGPWGLQIARLVQGGKYCISEDTSGNEDDKYWYSRYRVEAQVYLQQLLDMRMNKEEFEKVHQPVFLGYYYKNEQEQDQTVEVKAALKMFNELGTPADEKVKVAFPEAGVHVIAYGPASKAVDEVRQATFDFARNVLGMNYIH